MEIPVGHVAGPVAQHLDLISTGEGKQPIEGVLLRLVLQKGARSQHHLLPLLEEGEARGAGPEGEKAVVEPAGAGDLGEGRMLPGPLGSG